MSAALARNTGRERGFEHVATEPLERAGYRVIRLSAELVMGDLPAALRALIAALDE
jgi:very-short-patch-repair endonuclease